MIKPKLVEIESDIINIITIYYIENKKNYY